VKFKYSFLNIFTSSDLAARRLALMEAKSDTPGPVVWLTACVHGDEVGGMVVVQEVFKKLKRSPLFRGTLYAFPLVNPSGFETATRRITLSGEDLNRSFPGKTDGSLAERIAYKVFTTIKDTSPSAVLDLHHDRMDSIPYALLEPREVVGNRDTYDKAEAISAETGLLVVHEKEEEYEESDGYDKSLSASLLREGIPALTLELGEAYIVNEPNVADGVRSAWKILAYFGMVEPLDEPFSFVPPEGLKGKRLTYFHQHLGSTTGVIRFLVGPGDIVKKDQPVAKVHNVFGKLRETAKAQKDGIVLDHSESSVALPGVPMMAFGTFG